MSKPSLEEALASIDATLTKVAPDAMPDLRAVVAAARDSFSLSQAGGVGARFGVSPDTIANTYAWFTDEENADDWIGEFAVDHVIWDLVEGRQVS